MSKLTWDQMEVCDGRAMASTLASLRMERPSMLQRDVWPSRNRTWYTASVRVPDRPLGSDATKCRHQCGKALRVIDPLGVQSTFSTKKKVAEKG